MPQREKNVGEKIKEQNSRAPDKKNPQRPVRLPGNKQATFKIPRFGKPEDIEKFQKRKVELIDKKLFRNLNQPVKQVVEGTLKLT